MAGLSNSLTVFQKRLAEKTFLRPLIRGWERRIGLVVEDRALRMMLSFSGQECQFGDWPQGMKADFTLCGRERDLLRLFSGDELSYLHARQFIRQTGALRDQLKLDALLRLTLQESR
ncbi:SCP2 sterol-binding domain-containing protein [Brevibacillus humidisoli]|uniref:SCP2 sterol-binding domain-containing protein n=1 Tax=Brevibacillus humidisoli TaxID=2895522 RepID=UPI001E55BFBD|nr:SCP2 sterol-binding domain-containing protein [Brevibacillus humidisoli]UFJ39734.1 SCP2 sterol-binding domain-containing protein [Brevibacillus humidisoli]